MEKHDQFVPTPAQEETGYVLFAVDVLLSFNAALCSALSGDFRCVLGSLLGSCLFGSSSTVVLYCFEEIGKLIVVLMFEFVIEGGVEQMLVIRWVAWNEYDFILGVGVSTLI